MSARDDVVSEARRWIGTPYLHQASVLGAGTDCLGLLRGVWRAVIGTEPEVTPAYTEDWSEPAGREDLIAAAERFLLRKPSGHEDSGDVLIFRMRSSMVAKHVGLAAQVGPRASFIHAYSGHGVVESALSGPWARRIAARFEFPKGV